MEKAVQAPLRFHKGGRFRVLFLADFHVLQMANDAGIAAAIETYLENTNPDIVILGGDLSINDPTVDQYEAHLRLLIEPILRRGLPWAAVCGNHDNEMALSLAEQEEAMERIPGCLSQEGPKEISGFSNYCLEVLSSKGDTTAYHLWEMDTSPLDFNQVVWYHQESQRREAAAGRKIPAVMFCHVPVPEYHYIPQDPDGCGMVGEQRGVIECLCFEENPGLFRACRERGDVRGIFCGHDHVNDFHGSYRGITLGDTPWVFSACRVVDLREDGAMETFCLSLGSLREKS